jgi:hypothetical protein
MCFWWVASTLDCAIVLIFFYVVVEKRLLRIPIQPCLRRLRRTLRRRWRIFRYVVSSRLSPPGPISLSRVRNKLTSTSDPSPSPSSGQSSSDAAPNNAATQNTQNTNTQPTVVPVGTSTAGDGAVTTFLTTTFLGGTGTIVGTPGAGPTTLPSTKSAGVQLVAFGGLSSFFML